MSDPDLEWDELKAAANETKHGVSFLLAARVFKDRTMSRNRTRNTVSLKRASSSSARSKVSFSPSSARGAGKQSASSQRDRHPEKKEGNIVRLRFEDLPLPDSKVLAGLRRMTEAQIIAAAKSDPDNPPLTEEELKQFKRAVPPPDAKAIRKATGLSQSAFAWRYGFDVSAVRDWEQGRRTPDRAARVLLAIIKYEPKAVERALAAYAMSPYQKRGQARVVSAKKKGHA